MENECIMKKLVGIPCVLVLAVLIWQTAFSTVLGTDPLPAPSSEFMHVTIISINDLHGQLDKNSDNLGGAPLLKTLIAKEKTVNPFTYVVAVGDSISGSPLYTTIRRHEPTITMMKQVGVNLFSLGNHEFDAGVEELLRLLHGGENPDSGEPFEGAFAPVSEENPLYSDQLPTEGFDEAICANIVYADDHELAGELVVNPYYVKTFDDGVHSVQIGFIGIVYTALKESIYPEFVQNIKVLDEAEAINKYAAELRADGVNVICVVAHNSASSTEKGYLIESGDSSNVSNILPQITQPIDAFFCGHNHEKTNAVAIANGRQIPVVEAGYKGKAYAKVDFIVDAAAGSVIENGFRSEVVDAVNPNAEIQAKVNFLKENLPDEYYRIIGRTNAPFTREVLNNGGESELGRLVAESHIYGVMQHSDLQPKVALVDIDGLRSDLQQGDVKFSDVYDVYPFTSDLLYYELTYEQLKTVLEEQGIHGWALSVLEGEAKPISLRQVWGLSYTFTPVLNADTNLWELKVNEMSLLNDDGTKTPLSESDMIGVVVNTFLGTIAHETLAKLPERPIIPYDQALSEFITAKGASDGIDVYAVASNQFVVNLNEGLK